MTQLNKALSFLTMSSSESTSSANNLISKNKTSYGSVNPIMSSEVEIESTDFYLTWDSVSVHVNTGRQRPKTQVKTILNSVNGSIKSGSMTGLLGPSGAGKTTLLYALCNGLNAKVEGDIILHTIESPDNFRIGFVPQHDSLYDMFTVKETILFASRLQNKNLSAAEHEERVNEVLHQLDLTAMQDKTLDSLSDGERKRTSIATELVSNPKILFLDEPTSNLDSSNALNVVSILRSLCDSGPAVLISVHQPSKDILSLFHSVFLLSKGDKLYHGPPGEVMTFLQSHGYRSSENGNGNDHVNPAEFMIEVAKSPQVSSKYDEMLRTAKNLGNIDSGIVGNTFKTPMSQLKQKKARNPFFQLMLITKRIFQTQVTRKPYHTITQMLLGSIVGLLISYLPREAIGPRPLCVNLTPNPESLMRSLNEVTEAFTLYYMLLIHCSFSFGMTACMTFYQDISIISKEVANSWYSIYSYYFAKLITDILLLMTIFLPMFLIIYFCTKQPDSFERGVQFFLFCCVSGFLWQGWSQFYSIICGKNTQLTVMIVVTLMIPMYLLSGVFIKVNEMSAVPKALSWLSDMRFSIEGILIAIYDGRCNHITIPDILKPQFPNKSAMLNFFSIQGDQQLRNYIILVAHVIVAKTCVLLALVDRIWFKKRL